MLGIMAGAGIDRAESDEPSSDGQDARAVGFPAGEVDSGADGRFFRVTTTAEPPALEAEEPFTFTVRITTPEPPARPPRRIDLNGLPAFADRFYIPGSDDTPDDVVQAAVLTGLSAAPLGAALLLTCGALAPQTEWVFVYRLKPKSADVTEVPIFTFAYYDPVSQVETPEKRWHVPYADAIPLSVRNREAVAVPLHAPEWAFRLTQGDLTERRGSWSPPGPLMLTVLLLVPPLLGWCWYLIWRRLYPDAARIALQRRSLSARRALEIIARARGLPPARRADTVAGAVAVYLRERLDFPAAEPTPAEARDHLARLSCSAALAVEADQFFRASDAARFQPAAAGADSLGDAAERLVLALEAETAAGPAAGWRGRVVTAVWPLLAAFVVAGAAPQFSTDLSNAAIADRGRASFREGVTLREDAGRARPHFHDAANCFDELRRRGANNPSLNRNEGNAHLLADELGQAILAYRRGLRQAPQDTDLRTALAEARKRVAYGGGTFGRPPTERRPWWLPQFRAVWLFGAAICCYMLGWAFLSRWLMVRTRRPLTLGLGALAVATVLAASLVVTLRGEADELAHPLVVIVEDGVLLLKGNGPDFPPRYDTPVNQGVEARLLFERDGWLQIELAGGEVGWIRATYAVVDGP
jgi:hypothetical protein